MLDHKKSTSVLVADDHSMIADVVSLILSKAGNFEVTHAGTFQDALAAIRDKGSFDIVLLDFEMPGMKGLSSIKEAVDANSRGKVILFSGTVRNRLGLDAISLGARGYIPKYLSAQSLVNAITFVSEGEIFFPVDAPPPVMIQSGNRPPEPLSDMELQVLTGVVNGASNREIGQILGMSEASIKKHLTAMCAKMDAQNRTHLAVIAFKSGIVTYSRPPVSA